MVAASAPQPTRDYFRVEDEAGRRFWLYPRRALWQRERVPHWFCTGCSHEQAACLRRARGHDEFLVPARRLASEGACAAAALYGHAAIGIADRNTLAGVVRAYDAINELREKSGTAPKLLVGARLVFVDGTPDILAYPIDRAAYGRLCRLLSTGKLRAAKGECILHLGDLLEWQEGCCSSSCRPIPHAEEAPGDPFKKAWNTTAAAHHQLVIPAKAGIREA